MSKNSIFILSLYLLSFFLLHSLRPGFTLRTSFGSLNIFIMAALKSLSAECEVWTISGSVAIDVFFFTMSHTYLFICMSTNLF